MLSISRNVTLIQQWRHSLRESATNSTKIPTKCNTYTTKPQNLVLWRARLVSNELIYSTMFRNIIITRQAAGLIYNWRIKLSSYWWAWLSAVGIFRSKICQLSVVCIETYLFFPQKDLPFVYQILCRFVSILCVFFEDIEAPFVSQVSLI